MQTTLPTPAESVRDPSVSAAPAITVRGLTRTFGEVTAVDGLDLTIERGEIYGLLGPNGAGKSTTVKMLCTLLAPTGGQAVVAGHDIATQQQAVRLRIGVALQDVALDPKQTGLELLRLQGQLYGLRRDEIDQRLAELRALIDIGDALDRRIGTYSGGMRRRLDLAAALVHNPEVLFLDEPTTGLDPLSRASVWQEVRRLNDELGMTIFLTTQYLEEADELCRSRRHRRQRSARRRGHAHRAQALDRHRRHLRPHRGRRRRGARCARRRLRRGRRRGPRPRAHHQRRGRFGGDRPDRHRPARRVGAGPRPHPAHAHARRRVPRAHRHPLDADSTSATTGEDHS